VGGDTFIISNSHIALSTPPRAQAREFPIWGDEAMLVLNLVHRDYCNLFVFARPFS
jgi:hypothetical protein